MGREELFESLLNGVLGGDELRDILASGSGASADQLRDAANAQRLDILGQVEDAERAYQQRVTESRMFSSLTWPLLVTSALIILAVLAVSVVVAWNSVLQEALSKDRPVTVGAVAGQSFVMLLIIVVLAAAVATAVWWGCYLLSSRVRAGHGRAKDTQLLVTAVVVYVLLAVFCALFIGGGTEAIVWQLVHDQQPGKGEADDWGGWVSLGILSLFALAAISLWNRANGTSGTYLFRRQWIGPFGPSDFSHTEWQALANWQDALRQTLLAFLRARINQDSQPIYSTSLAITDAPGLQQLRVDDDHGRHVRTNAYDELVRLAAAMDGGSIALAGPRGAGKTQLLQVFCSEKRWGEEAPRQLSLIESVPVLFERREFMLHLFNRLCDLAIEKNLGTAQEAKRHKSSIGYLQTFSDEVALSAGWRAWNLSAKRGTALARQPQTYPEIVAELKAFLTRTARVLHKENQGRRLVIGIDELDRIEPSATARVFLNELKAVFDVPKCLFVLAVSDEALREAQLAPFGRRDAFDSAIDEVVRVEPLNQRTAEQLLGRRVVRLPVPFAALFYCLSGGMPRDLLRTARAGVSCVSPGQPITLTHLTRLLVERELARVASAAAGPEDSADLLRLFHSDVVGEQGGLGGLGSLVHQHAGMSGERGRIGAALANRAYHLDTVQQIFTTERTQEEIERACQPTHQGSFDALARAQRETGTADPLARATLRRVRAAWSLPDLPPLGSVT
ncbi:P-loop NTPase fold protein [Streptomyces griseorubiginosus]|uniref:P-loop NTPase fold protein n=1 Tax=Streptomyces griseorubiginosus TaxID=67304 RepID=UPI001AD78EAC|nr:P-loop NTPase fold protein [Streptomyces griseorubiginosus]MBO4257161.1 hypothetical protein [Streptomyces griseorubiginosus]